MSDKTILEQWRAIAYDQQADRNKLQQFWAKYFNIEKNIYAQLLENPDEVVTGTVKELAEKYNQEVLTMVGFAAVMAVVMIGGFIFGGEVA